AASHTPPAVAASGFASDSLAPHGGTLIDRFVRADEVQLLADHATRLPAIVLDAREQADLELIAVGAVSPLTGFLGAADYTRVLRTCWRARAPSSPVRYAHCRCRRRSLSPSTATRHCSCARRSAIAAGGRWRASRRATRSTAPTSTSPSSPSSRSTAWSFTR